MRNLKSLPTGALLLGTACAFAQQASRVTSIPDESPTELVRQAAPQLTYLKGEVGVPWFGGCNFVQALLSLERRDPAGQGILDNQRATRFVPTGAENDKATGIAARGAGLLRNGEAD